MMIIMSLRSEYMKNYSHYDEILVNKKLFGDFNYIPEENFWWVFGN